MNGVGSVASEIVKDEFEIQALKELAEIAAEMKKAGLLEWLKVFVKEQEEFLSAFNSDPALLRGLGLLGALMDALRRLDGGEVAGVKSGIETTLYCTLHGFSNVDPAKAKPRGLTGLMGALRDPDVQKGLGFLIDLAKALGACLNKQAKA